MRVRWNSDENENDEILQLSFPPSFVQTHTPEHLYYRWKVYMMSQGDSDAKWREEPFQMILGGPYWIPPKLEDVKKQAAAAEEASQSRVTVQKNHR